MDNTSFALEKRWRDVEPRVELVEIRFACSPLGSPAEWTGERAQVLVPIREENGGSLRKCYVALPCGLDGQAYLFHYYFLVIQGGRQRTTAPIAEQIVSREITYPDETGRYAAATALWGSAEGFLLNHTPLSATVDLERHTATETLQGAAIRGRRTRSSGTRLANVFRGTVWGPRGSTIRCVFHMRPNVTDGEESEAWDAVGGSGWQEPL